MTAFLLIGALSGLSLVVISARTIYLKQLCHCFFVFVFFSETENALANWFKIKPFSFLFSDKGILFSVKDANDIPVAGNELRKGTLEQKMAWSCYVWNRVLYVCFVVAGFQGSTHHRVTFFLLIDEEGVHVHIEGMKVWNRGIAIMSIMQFRSWNLHEVNICKSIHDT